MTLKESPSQTAGPYVHIGCTPNATGLPFAAQDLGSSLITGPAKGTAITITGTVFDGAGAPLLDAMVEIWQADADGLFASALETRGTPDPNFTGWGRAASDMETGAFTFETVKPGAAPLSDGRLQAPHVTFWIVARGINIALQTRMYFPEETDANATDPLLSALPDRSRIATLLAERDDTNSYRFNIRLQGTDETVFFDI